MPIKLLQRFKRMLFLLFMIYLILILSLMTPTYLIWNFQILIDNMKLLNEPRPNLFLKPLIDRGSITTGIWKTISYKN